MAQGEVLPISRGDTGRASRLAHLELVFDCLEDGLVTVDGRGQVESRNRAAEGFCLSMAPGTAGDHACPGGCFALLRRVLATGEAEMRSRVLCPFRGEFLTLKAVPLQAGSGDHGAVLILHREGGEAAPFALKAKDLSGIVGKSQKMQDIYSLIDVLSEVDTTVLITGESGTGKELVADALHYSGSRSERPLVKVNCAALSESLLESELFGHVKGAFTGAVSDKVGRFERAHGGTIFLDEIGDVPLPVQLRLLRVLQQKECERVGDATPIKVDVRILAATNQDLLQKIRQGAFREDLYYRLKVVNIDLPPLRCRKEDIPLLMEYFRNRFNRLHKRNIRGFSEEVLLSFLRHDWPGNVRELEHAVEHAAVLSRTDMIHLASLPAEIRGSSASSRYIRRDEVDQIESLRRALEKAGGNKAKAARLLGVSRQTLYRKLTEYGLDTGGAGSEPGTA